MLELDPRIAVRPSPIEGNGLFALEGFAAGERFRVVHGHEPKVTMTESDFQAYIRTVDRWDAVYLGDGTHLVSMVPRHENPGNYGNHSCEPNSALEGEGRIALRDIAPGEEITVDYALHSPVGWSMHCRCGSRHCHGVVRGTL